MRLLHLSDLHITPPFSSFDDVWSSPGGELREQRFDGIILSGDLVQAAARWSEYAALDGFLRSTLVHKLTEEPRAADETDDMFERRTRRRIVCVPGNHDVSWDAVIAKPVSIADMVRGDDKVLRDRLKKLARGPVDNYRLVQSALGHIEMHEVIPEQYPSRFDNLQKFFDGFYGTDEDDLFVPFRLRPDKGAARHWSAHVFPKWRVAIYGFNSCELNDCYWTGARLDARHITEAARHADKHARDYVRVAVWHHGMTSEPGRPDALTIVDIGRLVDHGFSVGFHGHIHDSEASEVDRPLRDRFVRVSAGTLSAGAHERPDAAGRQFSVVRLHPRQLHVDVYEERGLGKGFHKRPSRFFLLQHVHEPMGEVTRATSHRRTWKLDANGVATVRVEFDVLHVSDAVVLAIVTPPFCRVRADPEAESARGDFTVREDELPDGRFRYVMHGSGDHQNLSWEYMISNAFALDRAQLGLRTPPANERPRPENRWRPKVQPDEEAQAHTVRVPCDEFVMRVEFAQPGAIQSPWRESVRAVVEAPVDDHGVAQWKPDPDETARCEVTGDDEGGWCQLRVVAPLMHHRYGLVFKLAQEGKVIPSEIADAANDVLDECRNSFSMAEGLVASLNEETTRAVKKFLATEDVSEDVTWLGLLWSNHRRKLFTAFGRFRQPSWNVRFSPGVGVAGHAFRFARPAAWHRALHGASDSSESLIYQRQSELQGAHGRDYGWVLCVPIFDPASDAPLGIFSIASSNASSRHQGDMTLSRLALAYARKERGPETSPHVENLTGLVNIAFWNVVGNAPSLHQTTRTLAPGAIEYFTRLSSHPGPIPPTRG